MSIYVALKPGRIVLSVVFIQLTNLIICSKIFFLYKIQDTPPDIGCVSLNCIGRDAVVEKEGDEGVGGVSRWKLGAKFSVNLHEEVLDRVGRDPMPAPTELVTDERNGENEGNFGVPEIIGRARIFGQVFAKNMVVRGTWPSIHP